MKYVELSYVYYLEITEKAVTLMRRRSFSMSDGTVINRWNVVTGLNNCVDAALAYYVHLRTCEEAAETRMEEAAAYAQAQAALLR